MAKTVFSGKMKILNAWLNAVFSHRHDGQDQDGSAPFDYAADTGAADAYVITLDPPLTAYVIGLPMWFKVANANTTTTPTANFNSLGVKTIKKEGGAALVPGDLPAGHMACVIYNGTNLILLNPAKPTYAAGFESGTKMIFFQSAAPTGWTQITTYNDKALRVVSGAGGGSGGTNGLSSANTGAHTLTTSEIPAHTHTQGGASPFNAANGGVTIGQTVGTDNTGSTGGGGSHSHSLALAYVDVIICSKD